MRRSPTPALLALAALALALAPATAPAQLRERLTKRILPSTTVKVQQGSGDFLEWVTALTIDQLQGLHLYWSTTASGAASGRWVLSRERPGSDTRPLASGSAGPAPPSGKVSFFDVPLAGRLPSTPPENPIKVYLWVQAHDASGRAVGSVSLPVEITYVKAATWGGSFATPMLDEVIGTRDAKGAPMQKSRIPLAVYKQTFQLRGRDLTADASGTKVRFFLGTALKKELNMSAGQSTKLAVGELVTLPTPTLPDGPYEVEVVSPMGRTGRRQLAVGGQRPAHPETWQAVAGGSYANQPWTEECQGVTTDGKYWYVSTNNEEYRGVYKFSLAMQAMGRALIINSKHVGDLSYFDGRLWVALEQPTRLAVLKADNLQVEGYYDITTPTGHFSWVGVHPLTGHIMSSESDWASEIRFYKRVGPRYVDAGSLKLGRAIDRVQGGVVTPNGKLLISSDAEPYGIHVFNLFSGHYYGRAPFGLDGGAEEVEGLTVSPPGRVTAGGRSVNVHLVVLDNDLGPDDAYFKHFAVPALAELMSY